uniref:Uncharacterized protein n=1 Tax=viral metagenome TaxID=1070528 RepID=A0A6C0KEX7_9ZZZZ
MDNTSVLIFKAITCFISDLHTVFGTKHKSIALYNRLLEKTGIMNVGPIHKHIECFRTFYKENRQAMEEKKADLFTEHRISYSDRVYVDVGTVLRQSTPDNASIIWKHLLTIWGLIEPTSQAKRILQESIQQSNGQDKESQFLSDIIDKVEKTVGDKSSVDTSNPMAAVSNLMSSGVFTDLINGMQTGLSDGSLDIGKLMGSVQSMMTKMGGAGGSSGGGGGGMPDLSSMMSMMGPMMNSMGGGGGSTGGGGGGMPDLSAMMSMMGPMMSGLNIEEKKE